MQTVLAYFFGVVMLFSTYYHIANPAFYEPMIPSWLPSNAVNWGTALAEALVGILLFIPAYRYLGGLGFMVLMIVFLPLHVWDLFRPDPMTGSMTGAIIRLIIQFALIYGGWWIYKVAQA